VYKESRGKISLVILDLVMPEMSGTQCLEQLIHIDPTVRVLISSGFSPDAGTKEAINAQASGFVGKPYDMKQMLQAVRQSLDLN
jgi:two-component system, cell cycle sensor histidine kinase and response regulator CckA